LWKEKRRTDGGHKRRKKTCKGKKKGKGKGLLSPGLISGKDRRGKSKPESSSYKSIKRKKKGGRGGKFEFVLPTKLWPKKKGLGKEGFLYITTGKEEDLRGMCRNSEERGGGSEANRLLN